jgi:paraquat-inducible protein A
MELNTNLLIKNAPKAHQIARHHLYRALAFTLAAIAMYIPANLYPFMTMNYSGQFKNSTIWDGIQSLYEGNMWITATIVLMASIVVPVFKLLAMLFIIVTRIYDVAGVERASLLILIDFVGRWSMLDIFLVAIMVALVKFGTFATVTADIASYLLGGVVIFTMLASAMLNMRVKHLSNLEHII